MYLIKPGKLYDFMKWRRVAVILSVVLMGLSGFLFFKPGPKWGTDFKGGTELLLEFKKTVEPGEVREAVESIRGADGSIQFASAEVVAVPDKPNQFLIRVQEVSEVSDEVKEAANRQLCFVEEGKPADCTAELTPIEVRFSPGGEKVTLRYDWNLHKLDREQAVEGQLTERQKKEAELIAAVEQRVSTISGLAVVDKEPVKLVSAKESDAKVEVRLKAKGDQIMEGIKKHFGDAAPDAPISTEWIGQKAGAELRDAALKSIGIATFFIMIYIAFRFDLRFAPGAIFAIIHDVVIAMGAMVVTQKEITLSTVAAALTILGYSLSDTVVVYDRIRENLGRHRGMTFAQIVNLSVSEMLGRSIITGLTAIASMSMFLFFGTQVIKDFAFAMLVGIVVGMYSSIYVAAPMTEWIDKTFFANKSIRAPKPSRTRNQRKADAVV